MNIGGRRISHLGHVGSSPALALRASAAQMSALRILGAIRDPLYGPQDDVDAGELTSAAFSTHDDLKG